MLDSLAQAPRRSSEGHRWNDLHFVRPWRLVVRRVQYRDSKIRKGEITLIFGLVLLLLLALVIAFGGLGHALTFGR